MASYRLKYDQNICSSHYKNFSISDLKYMCYWYKKVSSREIALTLGRTQNSILNKVIYLKKKQEFDFYKELYEKEMLK